MNKNSTEITGKELGLDNAQWQKSTHCGESGHCVEVAFVDGKTVVRDSKNSQGPVLVFDKTEWRAFIGGVQDGEFNA